MKKITIIGIPTDTSNRGSDFVKNITLWSNQSDEKYLFFFIAKMARISLREFMTVVKMFL